MASKAIILDPITEALRRFNPAFAAVYIKQYDDQSKVDLIIAAWCLDIEVYSTLWFQFAGLFQIASFIWIKKDSDGNDRYSIVLKTDKSHVEPAISQ